MVRPSYLEFSPQELEEAMVGVVQDMHQVVTVRAQYHLAATFPVTCHTPCTGAILPPLVDCARKDVLLPHVVRQEPDVSEALPAGDTSFSVRPP